MYGGIVCGAHPISALERQSGLSTLELRLPEALRDGLELGASVALDGVCLTVATLDEDRVRFDVMQQTLAVTTLGALEVGDLVNVERSLRHGSEIGGHLLSGHVDGVGVVEQIVRPDNNFVLTVRLPTASMRYVFARGYLALNGCSLTAALVDKAEGLVTVYLIPETLRQTSFGGKKVGDRINFEVDRNTQVIVDTVTDILQSMDSGQIRTLAPAPP